MSVRAEGIGVAETGKAPALRAPDTIQRATSHAAAGEAGEDCAQSEAAATGTSRPGKILLRDPGRQAGAGQSGVFPGAAGFRSGHG